VSSQTAPAPEDTAPARPHESRACFLGVESSLTGKRWEERLGDAREAMALSQRLGVPEVVGRIMAGRGIGLDQAPAYLEPSLRAAMPDPSCLKDMEPAVERLVRALKGGETIAIFGDYDVDGATSAALLARFLATVGQAPRIYVPDRLTEGYGPNGAALRRLRAEGVGLVVTVDCGITAFEALDEAAHCGLDVIVVDHHAAEPRLPTASAVINPNRVDQAEPDAGRHRLGALAAVGVAFLLAVGLNRALRAAGWYRDAGRPEPDLLRLLDLVALGTVCDVVPLAGLNRALVAQGLKVMAQRGNPGLTALCDVARVDARPEAFHAGFLLGPRVNAGGRVGEAGLGAKLLSSDAPAEVLEIARRLDAYNDERRAIEADVLDQALNQIADGIAPDQGLVMALGEGWHPGVIGIVASRLKERTSLPALVIAIDSESGIGKGSGRSVPGVDLGAAVIAARQSGLLINGGGHAMAAGLTVATKRIEDLRAFLSERIGAALEAISYRPALGFDGAIQPGGATVDLMREIERCAPFGAGNPQPRFAVPGAQIAKADVVGEGHVRCALRGLDGGRLKAIAFRAMESELGPALLQAAGRPFHLGGKLRLDTWAGSESTQLIIEDAAPASG
jgi:single-stranded-DNA-specific exonuclease